MGNVVRLKGLGIRDFKARLQRLPLSLAHDIAQQAAPLLTMYAQEANARGENVYGDPYPEGRQWEYIRGEAAEALHGPDGRFVGSRSVEPGHWSIGTKPVTLVRTGDTRRDLRFVVDGTIIRCALGPYYAKYLIGKYKILPIGDRTAMPVNWLRALDELVRTVTVRPSLVAA